MIRERVIRALGGVTERQHRRDVGRLRASIRAVDRVHQEAREDIHERLDDVERAETIIVRRHEGDPRVPLHLRG